MCFRVVSSGHFHRYLNVIQAVIHHFEVKVAGSFNLVQAVFSAGSQAETGHVPHVHIRCRETLVILVVQASVVRISDHGHLECQAVAVGYLLFGADSQEGLSGLTGLFSDSVAHLYISVAAQGVQDAVGFVFTDGRQFGEIRAVLVARMLVHTSRIEVFFQC